MGILLFVLGSLLILIVFLDSLTTTLALEGAGPLSGRISGAIWRGFLWLHRRLRSRSILAAAATVTLLAVVIIWASLLWVGWVLLFSADPGSILHETSGERADLVGRFYFVGYTLLTLGIGDYVPQGLWRIATIFCTFHGLFVLTIGISYLLPVLGAATEGRGLAGSISDLGDTPTEVLVNAWTGRDFGNLDQSLISLTRTLDLHANAHKAYPVLHYFHSTEPTSASPLRIAVLDEALLLLGHAVAPEARIKPPAVRAARKASTSYLSLLESVYVEPANHAPPPPDLTPLREAGIPLNMAALHEALRESEVRRCLLLGLVCDDGWTWEDVTTGRAEDRQGVT